MKAYPILIATDDVHLDGLLTLPDQPKGIVLFAHGSGSSRLSPRNQHVASILNEANLATLLFDLLTPEEDLQDDRTGIFRFNIRFLADRLLAASNWVLNETHLKGLSLGYFGASTGGGAALLAAASAPHLAKAVVSRGGRPDLAGKALTLVTAPTLLIVGSKDEVVIKMNQTALSSMNCIKELKIIPGATHLFEEKGALDEVANLATAWFCAYL